MIDEEPEISDFYAGGMGWALEYNDFLLFSLIWSMTMHV